MVVDHGTPDETWLALTALGASRRLVHEIVVVDNGSPRGPLTLPGPLGPRVTLLTAATNTGFTGGSNTGIRHALAAGADLVALVNSDAVLPPDTLDLLIEALAATPGAGIAAPVILSRAEPDRVTSLGISYSVATGRMRHLGAGGRFSALGAARGRAGLPAAGVVDGVSGCAMLVRREVFERVGLLDEAYFFSFEDLDLCLRARRAGFSTVLAGRAVAYHEGSRTIGQRSARRLYFATRNHLRLAAQAAPETPRVPALARGASIVTLNVAHALLTSEAPAMAGLAGVARGLFHHARGRYGNS